MYKENYAVLCVLFIFALFCLPLKALGGSISRVHVFGDSHSVGCFRADNTEFNSRSFDYTFNYHDLKIPFSIHWLGPKTMHRIGRDGLGILNVKKYHVLENEVVVFIFGEIDVRCHIGKQRDQAKRALEEILDTLVGNYVKTIIKNRVFYNNINCVIVSVMPPTYSGNPSYPCYGTLEDRIDITKQLNSKLREVCLLTDIKFLDIYDIYANPNGSLNEALSDQGVHVGVNQNHPIKEALVNMFVHKRLIDLLFWGQ